MAIVSMLYGAGGASSAEDVSYDNTTSGLEADNVQDAIDELNNSTLKFPDYSNKIVLFQGSNQDPSGTYTITQDGLLSLFSWSPNGRNEWGETIINGTSVAEFAWSTMNGIAWTCNFPVRKGDTIQITKNSSTNPNDFIMNLYPYN